MDDDKKDRWIFRKLFIALVLGVLYFDFKPSEVAMTIAVFFDQPDQVAGNEFTIWFLFSWLALLAILEWLTAGKISID